MSKSRKGMPSGKLNPFVAAMLLCLGAGLAYGADRAGSLPAVAKSGETGRIQEINKRLDRIADQQKLILESHDAVLEEIKVLRQTAGHAGRRQSQH